MAILDTRIAKDRRTNSPRKRLAWQVRKAVVQRTPVAPLTASHLLKPGKQDVKVVAVK